MSFSLKNSFFSNSRGLSFTDGGGITWTFNKNTNSVTATASATGTVTSIGSSTLTIGGTTAVPTVNLSTTQVNNIAAGGTALQSASVVDSITGAGTASSPLQLSGDAASPGNSYVYGTNGSGTKGWYAASGLSVASASTAATLSSTLSTAKGGTGVTGSSVGSASGVALADSGTFTPTVFGGTTAGSTTYTNQGGTYTRLGNRCFFTIFVSWSAATGTGQLTVGGLPFTSNSATLNYSAVSIRFPGTDSAQSYAAFISPNSTSILIESHIASTGNAAVAIPSSQTSGLLLCGSYML